MSTFNAGAIEASLTLDRSSWTAALKEVEAQCTELEQKTVTISIDADTDNFFVQTNNVELTGEMLAQDDIVIGVDMDADKFHAGAAQVELVTDAMKDNDINVMVDTDGVPATLAELAELEVDIEIVKANSHITVDVDYDKNNLEALVGSGASGSSGGGGYMGFFQVLIIAVIALLPILSTALGAASFAIVAFTGALVAAAVPAAILVGTIILLIAQYKKAQKAGGELTPGMQALADAIDHIKNVAKGLIDSDVGNTAFKAMAAGVNIAADVLTAFKPVIGDVIDYFSQLVESLGKFTKSPEFDSWIKFFGGFGLDMLKIFIGILGNLTRFLMNLFIAIKPFARRMMKGLADDVEHLANWSENIGKSKGFQSWVDNAMHYGPLLLTMLGEIIGALIAVGDAIRPFAGPMIEAFTAVARALQEIPTPILTLLIGAGLAIFGVVKLLLPLVGPLAEGFSILAGAVEADSVAFGLALGPLILVIAGIAALAAIVVYMWETNETFRTAFIDAWHHIRDAVMPIIKDIVKLVKDNWPAIKDTAQDIWTNVQAIFEDAAVIIGQIIFFLTKGITFIWNHFGDQLIKIIKGVFIIIGSVFKGSFQVLRGIFDLIRDVLTGKWSHIGHDLIEIAHGFWTAVSGIFRGFITILGGLFVILGRTLRGYWSAMWSAIKGVVRDNVHAIGGAIGDLLGFFNSIPSRIANALAGIGAIILAPFRNALNTVVGWWNGLSFTLPGFDPPGPGPKIPGFTISTPNIPGFADGAWVDRPTLAMVGEGREPEFVTPESKLAALIQRYSGGQIDYAKMADHLVNALQPFLGARLTPETLQEILEKAGATVKVDASNDDRSARALAAEMAWELRVLGYGAG